MIKYSRVGIALMAVASFLNFSFSGSHNKMGKIGGLISVVEARNMNILAKSQQPLAVSIIRLIATPTAYNGKYVRVIGFVRIEFEGTAVYLHQDDYNFSISKNALWLAIDRSDRQRYMEGDQKYVLIEGTFDAKDLGHRGLFSGAIKNIKRFQLWTQRDDVRSQ
jgi:hypothetical protein